MILVVTETHDLGEAVDVLERILAIDRTDLPAIATRRELAATVPPTPVLVPRCQIPDWFNDLHVDTRRAVIDAGAAIAEHESAGVGVSKQIARLDQQLEQLAPQCAPHDQAIAKAKQEVNEARHQRQVAAAELFQAGRLHRHSARHHLEHADKGIIKQQAALDQTIERARPVLDQRDQLTAGRDSLRIDHAAKQRDLHTAHTRLETTTDALHTLTTWHDWATGHHIPDTKIVDAAIALQHRGGHHARLAAPALDWCEQRNLITFEPPQPQPEIQRRSRGIEIGF